VSVTKHHARLAAAKSRRSSGNAFLKVGGKFLRVGERDLPFRVADDDAKPPGRNKTEDLMGARKSGLVVLKRLGNAALCCR
jgi:hypothetical protein